MAFLAQWYHTNLPKTIVEILEKDIQMFDSQTEESKIYGNMLYKDIRNSKHVAIPTSHWIGGFLWYYIQRANRENFLFDLTTIDGEGVQYTHYEEGQFYDWHVDAGIHSTYKPEKIVSSGNNISQDLVTVQGEYVRKLSFSLQLSDPEDYTGGEVQFMDNSRNSFFAPKQKGTIILFDSRTLHRVRKVKSGLRKSLVGWVVGPRWK